MPFEHVLQYITTSAWALEERFAKVAADVILRRVGEGIRIDATQLEALGIKPVSRSSNAPLQIEGDVAIVPVKGVLSRFSALKESSTPGSTVEGIRRYLNEAAADPEVGAIILHVSSPGGAVDGIADLGREIRATTQRKPVVALIDDMGASAAYWLASQASHVMVTETAVSGSIGVMVAVADASERFRREGINVTLVKKGDKKGIGTPGMPITDEDRAEIQRTVDAIYDVFIKAVASGRGMTQAEARELGDGRTYVGAQNVKNGLADSVGSYRQAMNKARRLARERQSEARAEDREEQLVAVQADYEVTEEEWRVAACGQVFHEPLTMMFEVVDEFPATVGTSNDAEQAEMEAVEDEVEATHRVYVALIDEDDAAAVAGHENEEPVTGTSGETDMPETQTTGTPEPAAPAENPAKAERGRTQLITELSERHEALGVDWMKAMLKSDLSAEQIKDDAFDKIAGHSPPAENVAADVKVVGDGMQEFLGDMSDAIALRADPTLTQMADTQAHRRTHEQPFRDIRPGAYNWQHRSLMDMAEQYLRLQGVETGSFAPAVIASMAFNEKKLQEHLFKVRGEFSSGHVRADFPLVLADSVNKVVLASWNEAPSTWGLWMQRASTRDFKPIPINEVGTMGTPPEVKEGAEYSMAYVGERQIQAQVVKYGHAFQLTWETIINDDLSVFQGTATELGNTARSLEDDIAYNAFLSNPDMYDGNPLFDLANHNNDQLSQPIDVEGLNLTTSAMAMQQAYRGEDGVDQDDGRYLNIQPRHLITGPINTTVAAQASGVADPNVAVNPGTVNPFAGLYQRVHEPRVQGKPGGTTYEWYLAAGFNTVRVYFLAGNETPWIEELPTGSVDARKWKLRHVVGATPLHWKGLQRVLWDGQARS